MEKCPESLRGGELMKRLLLLLPLLLTAPVNAQVDPAVHKLCSDVKDYAGCVQTQMSLGSKSKKDHTRSVIEDSKELSPWQQHLNENPNLKAWVEANPSLAMKKKSEWEKANSKNHKKRWSINEDEEERCFQKGYGYTWDGNECRFSERNLRNTPYLVKGGCPPGTRQYQKTALFGLIKGAKLCLSDYEAESLRQAQLQNAITNMNQNMNRNRIINCTSNTWGSYMSTTCY